MVVRTGMTEASEVNALIAARGRQLVIAHEEVARLFEKGRET